MSQPSAETIEILRNIKTEIGAGMVMFPRGDAERGFNIGCGRANDIITNYERGYGLFQMVRDTPKEPVGTSPTPDQGEQPGTGSKEKS